MFNLKFYGLTAISIGVLLMNAIGIRPAMAGELAAIAVGKAAVLAEASPSQNRSAANPGLQMDIGLQPISFKESLSNSIPQRVSVGQATPTERQPVGLGVTARVGTLGVGLDVAKSFSPQLSGRLGINFGSINVNRNDSGINYDSKLNLSSVQLFGDYYPFAGNGFRVTGGLLSQSNKFSVTSTPSANGTYTIDNTQFNASDVGNLSGEFKYANSIAPYLGIGFGKPASEGLGFNADLGVMFTGSPKVTLNASNPTFNNNPTTRAQIDNQVRQTENDLKGFSVYPVLSIGLSYGF
jgi:hypothetical protein